MELMDQGGLHRPRKRGGRPRREPEPGERIHLGVLVAPKVKREIEEIATANGRSMSQEAELRLVRSLDRQALLEEVLALRYGDRFAGLLMLLGRTMSVSARTRLPKKPLPRSIDWTTDAETYDAAIGAGAALLDALHVPAKQNTSKSKIEPSDVVEYTARIVSSPKYERSFLPDIEQSFRDEMETIRRLIGPRLVQRLANAKPSKRREKRAPGAVPSARDAEVASKAIAETVLRLVNSTPRTPTREEIANVVLAHLKPQMEEGGNG